MHSKHFGAVKAIFQGMQSMRNFRCLCLLIQEEIFRITEDLIAGGTVGKKLIEQQPQGVLKTSGDFHERAKSKGAPASVKAAIQSSLCWKFAI